MIVPKGMLQAQEKVKAEAQAFIVRQVGDADVITPADLTLPSA